MSESICVKALNFGNPVMCADFVRLVCAYAKDPMGLGQALAEETQARLLNDLNARTHAVCLLAYKENKAIGVLNAFEAYSTFAARPLLNIHDIFVEQAYRGQGVGKILINSLKQIARERHCCKVTLEVLSNNHKAKRSYEALGFQVYTLAEENGVAEFWQCLL